MESSTIDNTVSNEAVAIPTPAPVPAETPAQAVEDKVEVPSQEAVEKEAAEQDKKEATEQEVEEEEDMEEEEDEPEPEEEEWVSEEEYAPKKRGRRSYMSESEEDEEYGSSKKRRLLPVRKMVKPKINLSEEPAGMKALRQYTSALKLGPRCFRGLNTIFDVKEREATLISRLHNCGRSWEGEYPSAQDIANAKEETIQKKAEKAREFIIEDGERTSRKAAQKARDFVKNLGDDEEPLDEDVDAEVQPDLEDKEEE